MAAEPAGLAAAVATAGTANRPAAPAAPSGAAGSAPAATLPPAALDTPAAPKQPGSWRRAVPTPLQPLAALLLALWSAAVALGLLVFRLLVWVAPLLVWAALKYLVWTVSSTARSVDRALRWPLWVVNTALGGGGGSGGGRAEGRQSLARRLATVLLLLLLFWALNRITFGWLGFERGMRWARWLLGLPVQGP